MKKFYFLSGLFLLLVLLCATPVRSQNSVQACKAFSGIMGVPVSSVQVTFDNELLGAVLITWECTPSTGFLYYALQRDGLQFAIFPTSMGFNDFLPQYGTYTYCVIAMYDTGPATPTCDTIEWANPTMVWNPTQLTATLFPGNSTYVPLYIGNTGDGTLAFEFPNYSDHPGDSPLSYCPASALNEDEFIGGVIFGTINNSSGWSAYTDYSSISTDLNKTQSYPVIVTIGPPSYTGDITGVWIDFDHSSTFDASEFTLLTGLSPATGTITVPATALTGPTIMRVRTQHNGMLSPCGTTPYGEVEDYTVIIHEPTFITSVSPASGIIAGHAPIVANVFVTFSATGQYSAAGVYTNQLALTSNDPDHASVSITAILNVLLPGYIQGLVTDCISGDPIPGVIVSAGSCSVMTNNTGFYSMTLSPGFYDVVFSKTGYQSVVLMAETTANTITTVNAQMCEIPYPPACAHASVNFQDTECTVSWCLPNNQYELQYDDGTPEDFAAWEFAGNRNAVKFTPQGYPATITGAKLFISNDGFGNVLGSSFSVLVCKPDAAGFPGQVIDSVIVTVLDIGWLTVTGLSAMITSGDFFIVMIQNNPSPNCPYLGVDETPPMVNKSYSRDMVNGGAWELSAYQDFIIRAIVSSPDTGYVELYSVTRIFLGASNPVPPASGFPTLLNNSLSASNYYEGGSTWANLAQGWYAYGVRANYPAQPSEQTFTNMVPHKMFADLTINAQLECGLVPAGGAIVKLTGINYPYYSITDTLSTSGTLTFSQIIQGEYTILVTYPGYETFTQTVSLFGNEVVNIVLSLIRNKPLNLHINESTLVAVWQAPRGILLNEDFEGNTFPPAGWQISSGGYFGWNATTNGSSDSLVIPPHTTYAVVNDQLAGAANNGCCDYLYSPVFDLRGSADYTLSFSSFFNGLNGQLAYVEISTDYGATWAPLYTCELTYGIWYTKTIDLSAYSGPTGYAGVMFAFHADDAGNIASGWAIDDVMVTYGGLQVSGYKVYLNGIEKGQTSGLTWSFDPATFNCDQYLAEVEAIYCTGVSDPATSDFSNGYLYPPANLMADTSITATSGSVILSWQMPLNCLSNLVSYRIYRNDTAFIAEVPATETTYHDMNLMPGTYCYKITSVYDLTPWGFPGLLGESEFSLPACADIIYGGDLPFSDDFSGGEFDTTLWNPGQNWLVDEDSDNPVPAAKFKWDPLMINYSSALESFFFDVSSENFTLPFKVWFDFDIKLADQMATSTEKLSVEVWNGTTWNIVKEYTNTGSSDWKPEHMDITSFAAEQPFKVRFRANGSSSDAIQYWALDNVHIYTIVMIPGPINLVAQMLNPSENEIKLTWGQPTGGGTLFSYILDDGTAEYGISFNTTGEYWVGNEFSIPENGVLQEASVFINVTGSAVYSIDVFDGNRSLVGSSEPFIPDGSNWTSVALPDIPFNGTFYMMLHMVVATESGVLLYDSNGPNSVNDPEWFYDGSGWSKFSTAGYEVRVCMVRATAWVEGKKSGITLGYGSPKMNYSSPLKNKIVLQTLNTNTGKEISHFYGLGVISDSIIGYNVYRRAYAQFPAGGNTTMTGEFTNIAFVTSNEYFDSELSNLETNCYEYYVTTVYTEGESLPSNIDWECIFTDVNPGSGIEVRLFPNPATTFIRIELNGDISDLKVYNSSGFMVTEENISGETIVVLNTSGYVAGMYTARFTAPDGESFSRKFVVTR